MSLLHDQHDPAGQHLVENHAARVVDVPQQEQETPQLRQLRTRIEALEAHLVENDANSARDVHVPQQQHGAAQLRQLQTRVEALEADVPQMHQETRTMVTNMLEALDREFAANDQIHHLQEESRIELSGQVQAVQQDHATRLQAVEADYRWREEAIEEARRLRLLANRVENELGQQRRAAEEQRTAVDVLAAQVADWTEAVLRGARRLVRQVDAHLHMGESHVANAPDLEAQVMERHHRHDQSP
ncbi:uncharacterized protein J3D65DRAFT_602030 [Phyllosticta citribraziliensis]|uniref:Chromosome partition protein Smc n=1 Tax=Phyllosticta citribraziliensis TaxID=989973 RepID=A0ABR1LXW5_9PEZI